MAETRATRQYTSWLVYISAGSRRILIYIKIQYSSLYEEYIMSVWQWFNFLHIFLTEFCEQTKEVCLDVNNDSPSENKVCIYFLLY